MAISGPVPEIGADLSIVVVKFFFFFSSLPFSSSFLSAPALSAALPSATSLADCLNTIPSITELLALICKNIEKNYFLLKQKPSMINELFHQNLFQKGGVQKFSKNGESFDGIINSVNENGQLLVEVNGRLEFYNMGEIKFMI